jgi:hypothetical protein
VGPQPAASARVGGAHANRQPEAEVPPERLDDLRIVTVTHQQSDLWTIAERHLGDGLRWTEIRELNQGRIMDDGRTFRSANLLQPGWKLLMPPDAKNLPLASDPEPPSTQSPPTPPTPYIVKPGDSLSAIAERLLGDANRYGEIFELNAGKPQPDGGRLTDPDQIWPGWSLEIPVAGRSNGQAPPPEVRPEEPRPTRNGEEQPRTQPEPAGSDAEPPQTQGEEPQTERLQAQGDAPQTQGTEPSPSQSEAKPPVQAPAAPPPQHTEPAPQAEHSTSPQEPESAPPPEHTAPAPSAEAESAAPRNEAADSGDSSSAASSAPDEAVRSWPPAWSACFAPAGPGSALAASPASGCPRRTTRRWRSRSR